jgi:hypothetical protein
MTIRGSYLEEDSQDIEEHTNTRQITGGIRLLYGGLEFNLKDDRGKSLLLDQTPVNPEFMLITENTLQQSWSARFVLPGGTAISFVSVDSARGPELHINAEFAGDDSEITIPISQRRSSLIRDNEQAGILYSGYRYFFSIPGSIIEEGKIHLSKSSSAISYRHRSAQRIFDPSDYIIAQAENYEDEIRNWRDVSFSYWTQNILHTSATIQNEENVIAYLSEAIQRGNYTSAVNAITPRITNSPGHSHRSSVIVGGMDNAFRTFISSESAKTNLITRLARERSLAVLREEHILDHLLSRSNNTLANEVIEIIDRVDPNMLTIDYIAGLLEFYSDLTLWRPNRQINFLTEEILLIISDNLRQDTQNDTVYVLTQDGNNREYNLRLGIALINWIETIQNAEQAKPEWIKIGRSLVLSALSGSNSGNLHSILKPIMYYPRAVRLSDDLWAWTISPSVNHTLINGNVNVTFTFPATMTHHVILRGVRPFLRLQIHGMDWRPSAEFERYDSSGWLYHPQEQTLVLRLRHRSTTENVRIIYREDPPPQPAVEVQQEANTQEAAVE